MVKSIVSGATPPSVMALFQEQGYMQGDEPFECTVYTFGYRHGRRETKTNKQILL